MRPSLARLLLPAALALSTAVEAQQVQTLVEVDDYVFGVGIVVGIEDFTISDSGDWFVNVKYREGIVDKYALLRNGIPTMQTGDPLASPEGAFVDVIEMPSVNTGNDFGVILSFDGYPANKDTGCFFNSVGLMQEGRPSQAPQFGSGTMWSDFSRVLVNDQRQIICRGTVEDPTISGTGDVALVLVTVDDEGLLESENVLLKQSLSYGGLGPLDGLGTKTHSLAFNNHGDFMVFVDTTDSGTVDGAILLNYEVVAREGHPSPVQGRNYTSLVFPRLDLNDFGDYLLTGFLQGDSSSNQIIVKNGEKFVQKGDYLPSLAPWSISNMGSTPIFVTNAANVFWFGQFNYPDTSRNKGIFLNYDMFVRAGETPVGSSTVKLLRTAAKSFHVPPDGRYIVFWSKLTNDTVGAYLIDMGLIAPMDECHGNTGTLVHTDGLAWLGERLEFEMDQGQATGVTPVLLKSTLPVTGWPPCGIDLGITGELLIDVSASNGNPFDYDVGPPWAGLPSPFRIDIPHEANLAGAEFFVQGLFWDIGDQSPAQNLLLTNGVRVMITAS